MGTTRRLAGWGNLHPSESVHLTTDENGLRTLLTVNRPNGLTLRGRGRAYGDPAQNHRGTVVELNTGKTPLTLNETTGEVTCSAALDLDTLTRAVLPRGWFPPVLPGTGRVSVGGAVACDIHGKNHHRDGSIGHHVTGIRLLTADGELRDLSPADGDLYWATVGGMGLTGAITEVRMNLLPVETDRMKVTTSKHRSATDLLDAIEEDSRHHYSVAWVDLSGETRNGRGLLLGADHASREELGSNPANRSGRRTRTRNLPERLPLPRLVTASSTKLFNSIWYHAARNKTGELQYTTEYFHPLDRIGNWNRLYGRGGFHQYQFLLPDPARGTLEEILREVAGAGALSPLVVMKRFGEGNPGLLSFPMPGWTLAIDLPAGDATTTQLTRKLDDLVLGAGGRHYLAKDSLMTPETLRLGYPQLDRWLDVKRRIDPENVWQSDLGRRLGLS